MLVGFLLVSVATRVALVELDPKLPICNVLPPFVMINLSPVNTSVTPSVLIKEYLSASKGKYTSFYPALTILVLPSTILTVYALLILRFAFVKLTFDIFSLGRRVNKVLSDDDVISVVNTLRS